MRNLFKKINHLNNWECKNKLTIFKPGKTPLIESSGRDAASNASHNTDPSVRPQKLISMKVNDLK